MWLELIFLNSLETIYFTNVLATTVMRQSACLVFTPITVNNYVSLFNSMPTGSGVRLYDGPDLKLFVLLGWGRSFYVCCLAHWGSTGDYPLLQIFSGVLWQSRDR